MLAQVTDRKAQVSGLTYDKRNRLRQIGYGATPAAPTPMRTYPFNKDGKTTAFEIENMLISRRRVARLLSTVKGVTDVRLGGHFGSANDIRVSFKYLGADYEVEEPYGDNARFLIGPKNNNLTAYGCGFRSMPGHHSGRVPRASILSEREA